MDANSRDVRLPRTSSYDQTIHHSQSPPTPGQHARYHPAQQHPDPLARRQPSQRQLRPRPSELLDRQYAEPPARLGQLQSRSSSKMSLFSLFSKPKVEKARGHSEPEPQSTRVHVVPRPVAQERKGQPASEKLNRTPSALPQHPGPEQSPDGFSVRPPTFASSRKPAQWEAPPLFQAYPQATKTGFLHIDAPSLSQQKQSQEPASDIIVSGQEKVEPEDSAVANFPKKIFILVTSGYLLQYAETGLSDRRPEKVMQLRENSAAFACDLGPGLRYVLQVSQRVDAEGAVVVNSKSIFYKLGIRGATAKRETSKFLLIMSSATEFEEWMIAIRAQIESRGGKQARPDTAAPRATGIAATDAPAEASMIPNQSHRYQIKRHPSRISVISPSISAVNSPENEAPPLPQQPEGDKTDTITIEDIEHELAEIGQNKSASPAKENEDVDTLSTISSSTTRSVERLHSDSLHNSQRISTTTTVATTIVDSSANSPTTSPTSNPISTSHWEAPCETIPTQPACRDSPSDVPRQRTSILPLCDKPLPPINSDPTDDEQAKLSERASLAAVANPYFPPIPPIRRMSVVNAAPDTRTSADARAKRDSRLSPALAQAEERPQSTLADLSPPSTWVPERVSGQRTSFILATSQQPKLRSSLNSVGISPGPYKARRVSGQAFSLPLKVNPSSPTDQIPGRQGVRNSRGMSREEVTSPVAAVHTLSAIVAPTNTVSIVLSAVPPRASSFPTSQNDHPAQHPPDAASLAHARSAPLSSFPMALPGTSLPGMSRAEVMRRSSSATSLTQQGAAARHDSPPQINLRRPVSLQVRSDHAPFLRNHRNSTHGTSTSGLSAGTSISRPVPIRNLRPSRSSTSSPTQSANAFAIESFGPSLAGPVGGPLLSSHLPSQPETAEESDVPSPLPSTRPRMSSFSQPQPPQHHQQPQQRQQQPLPPINPRSSLRASRKLKPHPSLALLDVGVPTLVLGPPAPPPNIPLPSLPAPPSDGMSALPGLGIST
nr:hypothetical protein CFP56_72664 [Quercus suber]